MFKNLLFCVFAVILFSPILVSAQPSKIKPKVTKRPTAKTSLTKTAPKLGNEKEEFEKAFNLTDLNEKIAALQKFSTNFPKSENRTRALEVIVSLRAQLADTKLRGGEIDAGIELFKQAVTEAPTPISEKLFAEVILQFPTNLFYQNQQVAARDVAVLIEEKVSDNPKQLLALATYYLGTENAAEGKRIAEKAIALDANLPAAYQTLGLANRLDFKLEESAAAYAKALELDPNSAVSKRSLAEMNRALGKSDDAITLYKELLEKEPTDAAANTGIILALFEAGKQTEAETEFNKAIEANPGNLPLLVGAAYWYAAHNQGEKAIDYAQKAIAIEPRYTWSYIALARGYIAQNRPLDAEKPLLLARQYGNFPTLDYELATVRMNAGFYQEAANELKKDFVIKDGLLETKLANRVPKQSANFIELLELERRASIFAPVAADTAENAEKIKYLLNLNQQIAASETSVDDLNKAVDEFVAGEDKMKTHRQLYAANRLLQEKKDLPKVLELTQGAIKGVDASLEVKNPAAAVLADELIESRTLAISRGEIIVVPEVPRQTLSAVLRGRIEETMGWALYQQEKPQEAAIRLKRAVSILPEKSSWWRSSQWKLGTALEANGNSKEALDAYIKSYTSGQPDLIRRSIVEAAYLKVNGNLDGLDDKIGAKPANSTPSAEAIAQATPEASPTTAATSTEAVQNPSTETTPAPTVKATPTVSTTTEPTSSPTIEAKPTVEVKPSVAPTVEATPAVQPEVRSEVTPTPTPEIKPEVLPESTPVSEKKTETSTEVSTNAATVKASSSPEVEATPAPKVEEKTEIKPEPTQSPEAKSETATTAETKKPDESVSASAAPKPLFDPIIINIPKSETIRPKQVKEKPTEQAKEKLTEEKTTEVKPVEEKPVEEKSTEVKSEEPKQETKSEEIKQPEETAATTTKSTESTQMESKSKPEGSTFDRPRVVVTNKLDPTVSENTSCLVASQDTISVLSNGGNLGIIVGYTQDGDVSQITMASNSPEDVTVSLEKGISMQTNRSFFVIRSISDKKESLRSALIPPAARRMYR